MSTLNLSNNRSRIMAAMFNIIAAARSKDEDFSIKQVNHHKKQSRASSSFRRRDAISRAEQQEKIEACAIKQARKARNRIHCYESSLFCNPIRNSDTQRRIDEVHAVSL